MKSADGFALIRRDVFSYAYEEQDRSMLIWIQRSVDARGYSEAIFEQSLQRWAPPHDEVPLDDGHRQTIRDRIEACLAFMGIRCHFTSETPDGT